MTTREVLPALLVAHDTLGEAAVRRVKWVIEGAGKTIVACRVDDFDASVAETALAEVGAYDTFLVIHVVGPLEDPTLATPDRGTDPVSSLMDGLAVVHASLRSAFPGKERIDQWVIHTVGQILDNPEQAFIRQVVASRDCGFRGMIISASATHASVTHDIDEQACFAADVVLALLGSDLERQLAEAELLWVCGAASVAYAAVRLGEAVSAHHALRLLEECLLALTPAGDPAFGVGECWVEDLDLPGPHERDLLLVSPTGGSLLTRVRMGAIAWDTVPITSWSDVLTTQQMLVANRAFDIILKEIEHNRQARARELRQGVIAEAFTELESSVRFESALTLLDGVRSGLEKATSQIPDPAKSVDPEEVESDLAKLRRFTRWLPFGPAVALRVFAAALGALVVVGALTGPSDLPILDGFAEPWGRSAALLVLLVGFVLYQRRLRTTLRIRDRLEIALERQLVDVVEQLVAEARRQTLVELGAWVGSRPEWLDREPAPNRPDKAETLSEWFAWLIRESRLSRDDLRARAVSRREPSGLESRYSTDIPSVTSLTTEELSAQLLEVPPDPGEGARTLVVLIRPRCEPDALSVITREQLESLWTRWLLNRLRPELWDDLGSLLRDRPSVRDEARRIVEANTTPAIRAPDDAPAVMTKHYLALPGGREGLAYQQMFAEDIEPEALPTRRVSATLTDVLDFGIPDVALMVHLYALDLETIDAAGDDGSDCQGAESAPADER